MATKLKSFLDLVRECDSLPYPDQIPEYTALTSTYYRFQLLETWSSSCSTLITVGYILPSTINLMPWTSRFQISHSDRTVTIPYFPSPSFDPDPSANPSPDAETDPTTTSETATIKQQLDLGRSSRSIPILQKWRNELYPILGITRTILIERSGSALFGIHTRGVHMMAYTPCPSSSSTTTPSPSTTSSFPPKSEMHLYIPRRAANKQTFPHILDTTVGGGITFPETPSQCLLREAWEEASLSEELVRERARAVGTVSYFYVRDRRAGGGGEVGLLQPATQFLWDIELRAGEVPTAGQGEDEGGWDGEGKVKGKGEGDREVEEFMLWSVEETVQALREGRFKPNSAVCWIEFLVRHGAITAESEGEAEYRELVERMHRRICF